MEKKIARKIEDLPHLQQGYVRAVHLTRGNAEGVSRNGLDYSRYGMLSSTARWWVDENIVEYTSSDQRFSGKSVKAVVMDIPANEIKRHDDPTKSPGSVPPKYVIGIIDPQSERKEKK